MQRDCVFFFNQVWAAYSPVKNSTADARAKAAAGDPPHSATTGELDAYRTNCKARAWEAAPCRALDSGGLRRHTYLLPGATAAFPAAPSSQV